MEHKHSPDHEAKDDQLTLLADHRRRRVLSYLRTSADDEVPLRELSTRLSDQHPDDEADLRAHLHHSALPRLDAAGVVEYDERDNEVDYLGDDDLEALLDAVADC